MYVELNHPTHIVSTGYEGMSLYSQLLIAMPVIPHLPKKKGKLPWGRNLSHYANSFFVEERSVAFEQ